MVPGGEDTYRQTRFQRDDGNQSYQILHSEMPSAQLVSWSLSSEFEIYLEVKRYPVEAWLYCIDMQQQIFIHLRLKPRCELFGQNSQVPYCKLEIINLNVIKVIPTCYRCGCYLKSLFLPTLSSFASLCSNWWFPPPHTAFHSLSIFSRAHTFIIRPYSTEWSASYVASSTRTSIKFACFDGRRFGVVAIILIDLAPEAVINRAH